MRNYRVTLEDAIHGHQEALKFGGCEGIRDVNAILSALARPYHGYHHWIYEKAAALVHGIITSHGFVDCNKRTAYYLVDLLTEKSKLHDGRRYEIIASDREIEDMFVSVANGETDYEELTVWFRGCIQPQNRE
ncbi:MAG: type II toxin-antitoxin system death-on-curing family toxin [Rhodobacteraceae bacterium]|nr:type II toxin-antitoxin system death-on-curing family toxin [Paracoccaceae bacterium]MYJ86113.1 type II toxin-antitoxin system death-on-curing family toxin [Paracoccaceae bacterium]